MMEEKNKSNMFHNANYRLFQFAEYHRNNPTKAEALLWEKLKSKQLKGFKFRRQHPIGAFILDFYCHSAKLGVELDGGYHEQKVQREYDVLRSEALQSEEINILRFKNEEVINDIELVLEKIAHYLNKI